jgi:hypothetical protein
MQSDLSRGFRIGDNIGVRVSGDILYYKITALDRIIFPKTLSAVGSGATVDFTEMTELNPPENEVYQISNIRLIKGNVKIILKQPGSVNRLGLERSPEGGLLTDKFDSMNLDLFIVNNYSPYLKEQNNTHVSITPVVLFEGWRYQVIKLTGSEQQRAVAENRITIVNGAGIGR